MEEQLQSANSEKNDAIDRLLEMEKEMERLNHELKAVNETLTQKIRDFATELGRFREILDGTKLKLRIAELENTQLTCNRNDMTTHIGNLLDIMQDHASESTPDRQQFEGMTPVNDVFTFDNIESAEMISSPQNILIQSQQVVDQVPESSTLGSCLMSSDRRISSSYNVVSTETDLYKHSRNSENDNLASGDEAIPVKVTNPR